MLRRKLGQGMKENESGRKEANEWLRLDPGHPDNLVRRATTTPLNQGHSALPLNAILTLTLHIGKIR